MFGFFRRFYICERAVNCFPDIKCKLNEIMSV